MTIINSVILNYMDNKKKKFLPFHIFQTLKIKDLKKVLHPVPWKFKIMKCPVIQYIVNISSF